MAQVFEQPIYIYWEKNTCGFYWDIKEINNYKYQLAIREKLEQKITLKQKEIYYLVKIEHSGTFRGLTEGYTNQSPIFTSGKKLHEWCNKQENEWFHWKNICNDGKYLLNHALLFSL
jgi:hypothetical protein